MDPTMWAWIGVVVGAIGPAGAIRRSWGVAAVSRRFTTPTLLAIGILFGGVALAGSVMLDGWWPWGAAALVLGATMTGLASWVGARSSAATAQRAVAAITRRGDRGGAITARDGATLVALAVSGFGLMGLSLTYLALAHWIEVEDPAAAIAGLALGAVGLALVLRMVEVPLVSGDRRSGPSVDLVAYAVLAPVAAMTIGLSDSEIGSSPSAFPLGVMAIGAAAAIVAGLTVRHGNPVSVLRRRGYLGASTAVVGGVVLALLTFDSLEQPLGMGLAVAAGIALAPMLGLIGELFTADNWRPVKRIAARSKSGPGPVVLAGIGDATRAGSLMVVTVLVVMVAAYRAGEFAADGGGTYGMAMAAVGVASTLSFSAIGSLFAPIARTAGRIEESASEVQTEAVEALAAAGSASGSVANTVIVGAGISAAFALLLSLGTTTGFGSADLGEGAVLLGLVLGAAIPLFAAGATAGTRTDEAGRWTEIIRLVGPVSVAIAVPTLLGIVDLGILRGFITGAVGAGLGVAGFLVIAGGAWDNARRVVETGAYGGPGSRAHRALVAADSIGEPFREIAGPTIVLLLALISAAALAFAGSF